MKLSIDVYYQGQRDGVDYKGDERGLLTDDHLASSYGIPVLVFRGEPHGIADLALSGITRLSVVWKKARTGPVWSLIQRALNAGYPIEIDPVG